MLAEYQARLAAQDTHGVVVVLQAMDAAGKDGTIRHVKSGVNPQGVEVHGFKAPSPSELGHDYLWRYQRELPARGHIGIFNRSHDEEVLVVRVHPQILAGRVSRDDPPRFAGSGREVEEGHRRIGRQRPGVRAVRVLPDVGNVDLRRGPDTGPIEKLTGPAREARGGSGQAPAEGVHG